MEGRSDLQYLGPPPPQVMSPLDPLPCRPARYDPGAASRSHRPLDPKAILGEFGQYLGYPGTLSRVGDLLDDQIAYPPRAALASLETDGRAGRPKGAEHLLIGDDGLVHRPIMTAAVVGIPARNRRVGVTVGIAGAAGFPSGRRGPEPSL